MGMTSMGFRLGEPATWLVRNELHRVKEMGRHVWRNWDFFLWMTEKRSGFIIGARTLRNGNVTYEEYGPEFTGDESVTALVLVYDMRLRPVLVRPTSVEVIR